MPTLRRLDRAWGRWAAVALGAVGFALAASAASAQPPTILATRVQGTITPVIADHIGDAVRRADREGHVALLVELDTPGGLDTSMREIIQRFLGSPVPVVVHVSPSGARAASAGALITMAAHVAAMAPGTAIGAATPVDLQGGDISEKIINDAAAYAESIARARGRNVEFAVDAVRKGRSVPADEAARIGVVDLIAPNRAALLAAVDGRPVRLASGREVTLRTADADVETFSLGPFRTVLQWLADPNLAFLFLSIGTLAILYELANPGIGAAGVVGLILIILALFGVSVLPVSGAGAILLGLAAVLFVAEIFTPGIGALAAGGTASLVLGGLFLFRGSIQVDPGVLAPVAAVTGGGALFVARLAWRTRRLPATTGTGSVVGHTGVVRAVDGDRLQVTVTGSWWSARPRAAALQVGQRIRVVGMEGLELIVEPDEEREEGT